MIKIIEKVIFDDIKYIDKREDFYIQFYKKIGHNLTNWRGGGSGWCGSKKERIPWNKGKTGHLSEEILENMSRAQIGKKQSAETIEKRIAPLRGKKRDNHMTGIPKTEEHKRKTSESLKGNQ